MNMLERYVQISRCVSAHCGGCNLKKLDVTMLLDDTRRSRSKKPSDAAECT
eukprot:COSAG02_NODE_57863_length_279_cov_0.616667_1_plen_50_part_10